jgi:hypothetical protein
VSPASVSTTAMRRLVRCVIDPLFSMSLVS